MTLNAGGTEASVVRLEEHDTDDVVANVTLALKLLRIVLLIGQQGGHVEHDLNVTPVRVDGEQT